MKNTIGRLLVFSLPILVNIRYLYIVNLDIFISTIFLFLSLFFINTDIFISKKYRGISLLYLIIIISVIGVLRSINTDFSSNIRFAYVMFSFSIGTTFLMHYFRNSSNIITVFFKGLLTYLVIVFIFTILDGDSNIINFFLSDFGILNRSSRMDSVNFIFTTLSNNHLAFLISVMCLFILEKILIQRNISKIYLLIFMFVMLIATRARVPIISTIILIPFIMKRNTKIFNLTVILLIPSALIIITNVEFLLNVTFLSNIFLSPDDLNTLNGRRFIWDAVLYDLSKFNIQHIFGYGNYGNLELPTLKAFLAARSTSENLVRSTTHNIYLQMITDLGYSFLILFTIYFKIIFTKIRELINYDSSFYILGIVILNFFICGSSESLWGNYYLPNYILIIVITTHIIFKQPLFHSND